MSWPRVVLGEAISEIRSGFASGKNDPKGILQIRMNNIEVDGSLNWKTIRRVPTTDRQLSELKLREGDILFNATNSRELVGKSALYREQKEPAVFSNHFLRIRTREDLLDGNYLFRYLHFMFERGHFKQKCIAWVNQATFSKSELCELEVPIPPIEEQRRIAAILDKADAVRKKRHQSLDMLNDFLRATFLDMFGDPATNPKGWDVKVLGESFSTNRAGTQSGPFGSALKKHEYVSTGVPVWGIDCVKPNHFREHAKLFITETKFQDLKRYSVEPGDILISRAGTVGRMCVACPRVAKSIISTNIVRVVLNQECMLPDFFTALFTYCGHRLEGLKSNQKDGAFTFLNPKKLRDLKTYRPPLPMQKRYVELTKSVRQKKEAQENFVQVAEDLFASLSQRAFRGDL